MKRPWTLCLGFALLCGCGQRTAVNTDGGASAADSGSDASAPCTGLTRAAGVTLEYGDTAKNAPSVAFDGERFAVVWHSQPAIVSSMLGELRFALVDPQGKASAPGGAVLAGDDGVMEAALLAAPTEYAVLHQPAYSGASALLRRFNATGKTHLTNPIGAKVTLAALAPHASGVVMLAAGPGGSPRVMLLDRKKAAITASTYLHTAEAIASVWLTQHLGGYAAALHTANANATLYLLDAKLAVVGQIAVGQGASVRSAAFATLPSGFAALYASSSKVELERFSVTGTPLGRQTVGSTTVSSGTATRQVALVWTGKQLIAGYRSAVSGRYELQILDASGQPVGGAIKLPGCFAVSSTIGMAWGKGRLAVVSLDSLSGPAKSCVCVTLLRCHATP
jgi:hypothetical protein